jgi:hypothetical protein
MAKYTKKYRKQHIQKKFIKKTNKNVLLQKPILPSKLSKLINKYNYNKKHNNTDYHNKDYNKDYNKDNNLILVDLNSVKTLNRPILIGNYIKNLETCIRMENLKINFKKYFTLNYMNYLVCDNNKKRNSLSTKKTISTHKNQPIILEGYLLLIIEGDKYRSHMLDKIKMISADGSWYFPEYLPDNFTNKFTNSFNKIYEIINQVFTILKYIAIICGHNIQKPDNIKNAIEIVNVRMNLYNDHSVILKDCKIKRDWLDNYDNNLLYEWLDNTVLKPILGKSSIPDLGISTLTLYKLDYKKYRNVIPKQISALEMTRKDFNNKFIIVYSNYLHKKETDIDYNKIEQYLYNYGLTPSDIYSSMGTQPAFIWFSYEEPANYNIIRQHYNTNAYLGNCLDSLENIDDKELMFTLLKKTYPNDYKTFLADSFPLTTKTKYVDGEIYIARPITSIDIITKAKKIKACSGRDIIYITNEKTMNTAKELLERYDKVLISKYIRNPLLFKNRKFHLRLMYLITLFDSIVKTYLLHEGIIITAKYPFKLANFDDMYIHDTHYKTTDDLYFFTEHFKTENMSVPITSDIIESIWEKIRNIMKKVSNILVNDENHIKSYNNIKYGFEIIGVDIMITDNMEPILIECNINPGFGEANNKKAERYHTLFCKSINENVLMPVLGNKINQNIKASDDNTPLFIKKLSK